MVEAAGLAPIQENQEDANATWALRLSGFFARGVRLDYDRSLDTLFLEQRPEAPAVSWESREGWVLRIDADGEIVGIEIQNFRRLFLPKYPDVAYAFHQARSPFTWWRKTFRRGNLALVLEKLSHIAVALLGSQPIPPLKQQRLPLSC